MKSVRRFLMLFVVLITFVGAGSVVAGCGGDDDGGGGSDWAGQTVKIGSLFSTTEGGAAFGPQQVKAAKLAIQEINADDGVNGARLELVQRNDRAVPARSAKLMRRLVEDDNAMVVLGPTFSNSAAVADPVANRLSTPVLAVSNTGPGIVGDCPYSCDFIFRDSLSEAAAIPENVKVLLANDNSIKQAKVFYPAGDDFGKTSAETAANAFKDEGVGAEVVETEADGKLGSMKADGFDAAMVTASSGATATAVVQALRELGFDGPTAGGNAFNSPVVSADLGEQGKGLQSASAWYSGNDSEENRDFIAAYENAYGQEPDQFAAQSYTGVKILAEALDDADLNFEDMAADRAALRDAMEKVDLETPLGQFSFTADHDVNQPIWIVAMDGKGGYDLVKKVTP